ncbi:MAG: terminase small subunit [Proteobacteria bacterium]|nr:terminase small subunit [Pseudomonadota bacterium]
MAALANPKHERFCNERMSGKSGAAAYQAAYGEDVRGADQAASRLLKRDDIQARGAELQSETAQRNEVTADSLVAEYDEAIAFAKGDAKQTSARVNAITAKAKITGAWMDKPKSAEDMSDEELVKQMREASGDDRLADLMAAALKHSRGEDITEDLDKIEANLRQAAALSHSNGKDKQPPSAPTET